MSYCAPLGLPHSEFLSWDEEDQDKALAWTLDQRQRCSGCGTKESEWLPDEGGDRHAYEAELWLCPGCERRGYAREQDAAKHPGAYVRLVKKNK